MQYVKRSFLAGRSFRWPRRGERGGHRLGPRSRRRARARHDAGDPAPRLRGARAPRAARRCRPRRSTSSSGSRRSSTPTATSSSRAATTPRRTRSSASGSGYAPPRASSRSSATTSSSRRTAGRYRPGQRVTNPAHLPPKKLRYLMQTPTWCRERAAQIGPATAEFIERLLGDEVLDRLRGAQATLRLAE